ncbi:hypothetical protein [Ralstonia sp. UBA689]|uniref:hypothetical protein n=1 Tax=Ralstonia sp. UBA689 TaxID=1947373 RepID=UPI0025F52C78|nr:hypothetical protein [Ralstonia sp. UBA689]
MDPTSHRSRVAAFLPGVLAACAAALLGGCVVAPYYDAYGNPIAPAAVAPAPAYPAYSYDPYYYYGPAVYPAPIFGSVWIGGGGCWGCHRGWGGRNWGHGGWSGRGGGHSGWGHRH